MEPRTSHGSKPKIPPQVSAILAALLAGFLLGATIVLYLVAKLTFRFASSQTAVESSRLVDARTTPVALSTEGRSGAPLPPGTPSDPTVVVGCPGASIGPGPALAEGELLPTPEGPRRLAIPVAGIKAADLRIAEPFAA